MALTTVANQTFVPGRFQFYIHIEKYSLLQTETLTVQITIFSRGKSLPEPPEI